MSELEITKQQILGELKQLCAHCRGHKKHSCPVQSISARVQAIKGIPLIVNNEFRGVVWR